MNSQNEKIREQLKSAEEAISFCNAQLNKRMSDLNKLVKQARPAELVCTVDLDVITKGITEYFYKREGYEEMRRVLRSLLDE